MKVCHFCLNQTKHSDVNKICEGFQEESPREQRIFLVHWRVKSLSCVEKRKKLTKVGCCLYSDVQPFFNRAMNTCIGNVKSTLFQWFASCQKFIRWGSSVVPALLFLQWGIHYSTQDAYASLTTKTPITHAHAFSQLLTVCSIFTRSNRCDNSMCELCDSQCEEWVGVCVDD